ncbi:MAG: CPBP family intramembrane glutamic endopeptidase [Woeseiaceae bacterium]|jgi:membrane protease YdiL (CAAX protease family)|nr:CPBP family intramembrane glutamic endopeptidase [Woeseiaceae bacterium]
MSIESSSPRHPHERRLPSRALFVFFPATFAIAWGIIGSYIVFPDVMTQRFGQISGSHPLFFVATWAPAIAGLSLVAFHTGPSGLRAFLSRLLLWRCNPAWWAFIAVGIPLTFVAGSLLKGGPVLAPLPPEGAGAMLAVMLMMLFLGPIEEFGWRGVAQPLLQRHLAPFWSGTLIGVTWGLWHLPAFHLAGVVFADWNFLPFFVGNVTLAILVTPIFNAARGSLLLPMLFHWQLINPFWPDAQPYDTWILVGITVAVTWWRRDTLFRREAAVTDVVPRDGIAATGAAV